MKESTLKVQVPGVSMRPPPCTDAGDLLRCSATLGNLGVRGEPDILTYMYISNKQISEDIHIHHVHDSYMNPYKKTCNDKVSIFSTSLVVQDE